MSFTRGVMGALPLSTALAEPAFAQNYGVWFAAKIGELNVGYDKPQVEPEWGGGLSYRLPF